MKRKEFLSICAFFGASIPFQMTLTSCRKNKFNTNEKILIIGAGAAGMTAGYLLEQMGVEYEILEASSVHGGRMRINTEFTDFPIPLGAEWLHVGKDVLSEIVNDCSTNVNVPTVGYDLQNDIGLWNGQEINAEQIGFGIDQKFIGGSWFNFFEDNIYPSVQNKIKYEEVVNAIDYSDNKVNVSTQNQNYSADRVIVTIPVRMMQQNTIAFTPELPNSQRNAFEDVTVWSGFKAFFEFSERFYPEFYGNDLPDGQSGEKLFYDASYGQNSDHHVFGLFSVGDPAEELGSLSSEELKDSVLEELDSVFGGQASDSYIQHIGHFWNDAPHIGGAYITDNENWTKVRKLGNSIDNKLYFAGCSYTDGEDWSSVHTAGRSAINVIEEMTTR